MFYLLLAIVCSGSIALIFKYSESKECNRALVTTFNYLTATVISAIALAKSGLNVPASFDGIMAKTMATFFWDSYTRRKLCGLQYYLEL